MKKYILVSFAVLSVLGFVIVPGLSFAQAKVGDVNGDGFIGCADVGMILKSTVGSITLTTDQKYRADVNGDKIVTVYDASILMQRNAFSCNIGDVNGDGTKGCADVGMILKSVVGSIILNANQKYLADVNGNGTISPLDASLLMVDNHLSCKVGDVNSDGSITCADSNMILKSVVGSITLTANQRYLADVNGNGTISPLDASLLIQQNKLLCN
jgi:hypothetical protein